jgi:hypothetical protein
MSAIAPIEAHFMHAFRGSLTRLGTSANVEDVMFDIGDLDADSEIEYKDLPQSIPQVVRKRIVALSRQRHAIANQISRILSQLDDAAESITDQKAREETLAKPHCPACKQVLPPKKRSKKRA